MRKFANIYTPTSPLCQQFPQLEANQPQFRTLTVSLAAKKEHPRSTGRLEADKPRNCAGEDVPVSLPENHRQSS